MISRLKLLASRTNRRPTARSTRAMFFTKKGALKAVLNKVEKDLEKRTQSDSQTKVQRPKPSTGSRLEHARGAQLLEIEVTTAHIRRLKNEILKLEKLEDETSKKRLQAANREWDDETEHLRKLKQVW